VTVAEGSWFDALPERLRGLLGVVVANPPYVDRQDEIEVAVATWEPAEALYANRGGTEHLEHLVSTAPSWLRPDGVLVLEMDPKQIELATGLANEHFCDVVVEQDLAGRDRCMVARRPKPLR